ncbi:MAG: hypothetical protein ACK4IZ_03360 [Flavobacterium sp.]|uniref:hypothetical protein n=1 Tax=Flavobacterium sp. TaxID=239 RepID=UPI00391A8A87
MEFDFTKNLTKQRKIEFADLIKELSERIGFKVSSRGWCYIMEQSGYINKDQFDKVANAINDCRKEGYLPVDFVAEESSRAFSGVEKPDDRTLQSVLKWMLEDVLDGAKYFNPDWWDGEEYYIQMVVEKIDLVTLFSPVCREYHIPIANAKGWSSISQRAEYARRFKEAENIGLKCVLLYCGDHDPDGLRISETLRSNLNDVKDVYWSDGEQGYNPKDLIIDRFGLNYEFIQENGFTWIDNLVTGSGKDLSDPRHRNYKMPYVQEYLKTVGARKCEANVIVTMPRVAKDLVTEIIEKYLGDDSLERFKAKRDKINEDYEIILDELEIREPIQRAIDIVDKNEM